MMRQHRDQVQVRVGLQRAGDLAAYLGGPQVLVLDVDQPASLPEGLDISARDAAFTTRSERVTPQPAAIGAQELYDVGTGRSRGRTSGWQRSADSVVAAQSIRSSM